MSDGQARSAVPKLPVPAGAARRSGQRGDRLLDDHNSPLDSAGQRSQGLKRAYADPFPSMHASRGLSPWAMSIPRREWSTTAAFATDAARVGLASPSRPSSGLVRTPPGSALPSRRRLIHVVIPPLDLPLRGGALAAAWHLAPPVTDSPGVRATRASGASPVRSPRRGGAPRGWRWSRRRRHGSHHPPAVEWRVAHEADPGGGCRLTRRHSGDWPARAHTGGAPRLAPPCAGGA